MEIYRIANKYPMNWLIKFIFSFEFHFALMSLYNIVT